MEPQFNLNPMKEVIVSKFQQFALLVFSGVMLACAFPPFPTGFLAALGFVPLLIVLDERKNLADVFKATYVAFFVWNLIALAWISGFTHLRDIYLFGAGAAVVLVHPVVMTIPMIAYAGMRNIFGRTQALVFLPFFYVAFEYVHSITEFAFPWLTLGNTQTYNLSAIQFASITGVYGISFWLVVLNVLSYYIYKRNSIGDWKWSSQKSISLIVLTFLIYLAPQFYGSIVLRTAAVDEVDSVRIGIVQPNIDPFEKWSEHRVEQFLKHQEMTEAFRSQRVDMVIWPETATPFYILTQQNRYVFDQLMEQVSSIGTPLLTGIPDVYYYRPDESVPRGSKIIEATGERYDTYNSSMLVHPHRDDIQKYAKIKLVPFAERVPYLELYPFMETFQWQLGLGGWGIGRDTAVLQLTRADSSIVHFSNMICYESIYPSFVAGFVRRGAQFLTIITNDSWWGNLQGPYQHEQYAVLRAIETRRWIARCANGGISCFIDPYGRIHSPTTMFTKTILVGSVKARNEITPYVRAGDWLAQLCVIVFALGLTAAMGQRFRERKRRVDEPT